MQPETLRALLQEESERINAEIAVLTKQRYRLLVGGILFSFFAISVTLLAIHYSYSLQLLAINSMLTIFDSMFLIHFTREIQKLNREVRDA